MDKSILDKYEVVVGLEVHAQLLTASKAYSWDSTEYGQLPNTNISVITLAHPGTLPKFNAKALEYAIKMGIACGSSITEYNIFDRKNYFYPDLPKGFQITQDKTPICRGGLVNIKTKDGVSKDIVLTRIHMEEDAGKSIHAEGEDESLIDYNRAGVPLIEIVSEPDIRSGEEAYAYLTEVRRLVRYLDICDGNMEEGSLRCDANISVRLRGAEKFGVKVEVKNMNSIRNVQRAIEHEFERQVGMIENNITIVSETRTFDALAGTTSSMRLKESLNDYRYFPEPDLQPVIVTQDFIAKLKSEMPALPQELKAKFINVYGLPEYDAGVLVDTKEIALYFEDLCKETTNYKAASNWLMGPVKSYLNELTLSITKLALSPKKLAEIIALVDSNQISFAMASQALFPKVIENPSVSALEMAQKLDLLHNSNSNDIAPIIEEVLAAFPDKVEEYRNGKKGILAMFMGQVMKKTKGKVDPKVASDMLIEVLDKV